MYTHPKVHSLSANAFRVHIGALLHSSLQLTDGKISSAALYSLTVPGMKKMETYATELVDACLWLDIGAEGWQINDYLDFNPCRADVLAKRKKEAERKAAQRAK